MTIKLRIGSSIYLGYICFFFVLDEYERCRRLLENSERQVLSETDSSDDELNASLIPMPGMSGGLLLHLLHSLLYDASGSNLLGRVTTVNSRLKYDMKRLRFCMVIFPFFGTAFIRIILFGNEYLGHWHIIVCCCTFSFVRTYIGVVALVL